MEFDDDKEELMSGNNASDAVQRRPRPTSALHRYVTSTNGKPIPVVHHHFFFFVLLLFDTRGPGEVSPACGLSLCCRSYFLLHRHRHVFYEGTLRSAAIFNHWRNRFVSHAPFHRMLSFRYHTAGIPGVYHTAILFLAWRNYPGYSYDMIPAFQ